VLRVGILILLAAAVFGALVYACLRPARILGVEADQLAYSVSRGVDSPFDGRCDERTEGEWVCGTFDEEDRIAVRYRVTVEDSGCWDARRLNATSDAPETQAQASGCITVLDYLELRDTF
jgi:hypothetical protein